MICVVRETPLGMEMEKNRQEMNIWQVAIGTVEENKAEKWGLGTRVGVFYVGCSGKN